MRYKTVKNAAECKETHVDDGGCTHKHTNDMEKWVRINTSERATDNVVCKHNVFCNDGILQNARRQQRGGQNERVQGRCVVVFSTLSSS